MKIADREPEFGASHDGYLAILRIALMSPLRRFGIQMRAYRDRSPSNALGPRQSKVQLLCVDTLALALVGCLTAAWLRGGSTIAFVAVVCAILLSLYIAGFYEDVLPTDGSDLVGQLVLSAACALLFLGGWVIGTSAGSSQVIPMLVAAGSGLTLFPGWRLLFKWILSRRAISIPVIVVGSGKMEARAFEVVRSAHGLKLLGTVTPQQLNQQLDIAISRLPAGARVVLALDEGPAAQSAALALRLQRLGHAPIPLPSLIEELEERLPLDLMEANPIRAWSSIAAPGSSASERLKRVLDITGAVILAAILAPPALLMGGVMCLTSPGPMFYRQWRVGKGGHLFQILKLRSMRSDAEHGVGAVWAQRDDPRVPQIGRLLRRSRLDEVPQVWNVLRGEMSLVGPRPERPEFTEDLVRQIPHYNLRHVVPPGLTGWAQVRFPYGASVDDSRRKLEYDLYYIRHWHLLFDVRILLRTVRVVLLGKGAR